MSLNFGAVALAIAATVTFLPTNARADSCDDECNSDGPPCSVDGRCPDSGIECADNDDQAELEACQADAEAKGLEKRCEGNSIIYCDPGEEVYVEQDEGCSVRSPRRPARGLEVAGLTFAAAALATYVRARRRARPR